MLNTGSFVRRPKSSRVAGERMKRAPMLVVVSYTVFTSSGDRGDWRLQAVRISNPKEQLDYSFEEHLK